MTPGKDYGLSKFFKKASNKIRFSINFENPRNVFLKIRELFIAIFFNVYEEKMFTIAKEDWRKAPQKPSINKIRDL